MILIPMYDARQRRNTKRRIIIAPPKFLKFNFVTTVLKPMRSAASTIPAAETPTFVK